MIDPSHGFLRIGRPGGGWKFVRAVLTPDELREVLVRTSGALSVNNRRTEPGGIAMTVDQFVATYSAWVDKVSGLSATGPDYCDVYCSVAVRREDVIEEPVPARYGNFVLSKSMTPLINIAPESFCPEKESLRVNAGGKGSFHLGLAFSLASTVAFSTDDYMTAVPTDTLPIGELFNRIKASVHAITAPVRVMFNSKEIRPNMRASKASAAMIQSMLTGQNCGVTLLRPLPPG